MAHGIPPSTKEHYESTWPGTRCWWFDVASEEWRRGTHVRVLAWRRFPMLMTCGFGEDAVDLVLLDNGEYVLGDSMSILFVETPPRVRKFHASGRKRRHQRA